MNKDVLVALIAKDVNELQVLTEGIDQMDMIPAQYLRLALDKSKSLTDNISNLIEYLGNATSEFSSNSQQLANLEVDQVEEAALQADLDRIAEEQEALFRAEELERERQEEARRQAEAEMARQAAAIEAVRQAELEEKRRQEEEAKKAELIRLEEEARIKEEQELERQREEKARKWAEEIARRAEEERLAQQNKTQEQEYATVVETVVESQPTTLADSIETTESLADKLSKEANNSLASALNNKKIEDLKTAITLVDRFRFQRELFGGNGEKMNKAIADFNSFVSMREAEDYISKNFDWSRDNEAVSDFIQLLQRRYI